MQIRALLNYFDTKTKVSIKCLKVDEGNKKSYYTLVDMTVEEITATQTYYNSILDKNINERQITIVGGKLNIVFTE